MRKVKLQMQVSVDGFVAGPNGEQDWMVWQWDEVLKNYAANLVNSSDTFLLGRVTYEGMATYWPTAATTPNIQPEEATFANTMNNTPKIIFYRTLDQVGWSRNSGD